MSDILRLYVYQEKTRIGLVESITSLQWMPAFDDAGEFKLVCAPTEKNLALLAEDALLYNPETQDIAGLILAIQKKANTMTVRGKFSLYRFHQRVAKGSYAVNDAAAGLLSICRDNLRGLPVALPAAAGFSAPCSETVSWTDCCSAIVQLAQAGGFGARVRFDPLTAAETLELRRGTDRSTQESPDYVGYLGTRLRNLTDQTLDLDISDYANVIICAGESPSETDTWQRTVLEVGAVSSTGSDRHELFVDGSGVTHRYTVQNPDGSTTEKTYSEAEYRDVLTRYAGASLANHLGTRSLTATAKDGILQYGTDYQLGDTLPVRIPEWNLAGTARVKSLKIIYEKTGRRLEPVFDTITLGGELS